MAVDLAVFLSGYAKKVFMSGERICCARCTTIILNLNISLQCVSLKPSLVKAVSEKRFVTEFSDLKVTCTPLTPFSNGCVFYSFVFMKLRPTELTSV